MWSGFGRSFMVFFNGTQWLGTSSVCANISFIGSTWRNIGVLGLLKWGRVFRGGCRGVAGVGAFRDVLGVL